MSTPPLLIHVLPEALPEEYRRLIDPNIPLAEPERFLPEPPPGGFFAKVGLGVVIAFTAVIGQGVGRLVLAVAGNGDLRAWVNLALGAGMLAVLLWFAWRLQRRVRLGRQQRDELAEGRYREGLFLTRDALLTHYEGRCDLVPRERIHIERRMSSSADGGARPVTDYFVFPNHEGRETLIALLSENVRKDFISPSVWLDSGDIYVQESAGVGAARAQVGGDDGMRSR
jgi:hypothetical protein